MIPTGLCECGCGRTTPIVTHTSRRRGHIKGRHLRFISGHNTAIPATPVAERFWPKVKRRGPDDCWLWCAAKSSPSGHGSFHDDGGVTAAARTAYRLTFGHVPKTLFVLHRCDNGACCNPAHLFLGTQTDNMRDCVVKGRISRGRRCPSAKLTDAAVREIRRRRAAGERLRNIAAAFGVGSPAICNVVNRVTWKHVS